MPAWLLWILVIICEIIWRTFGLKGAPPIPREGIAVATHRIKNKHIYL